MVKCSLHDRDWKAPCNSPETNDTKYCMYCLTEIDLCHWATHIQGKYHKVSKIINTWLKCFCWYKIHEIAYHHWGSCKECYSRLDESSKEDDPPFHEEKEYNPEQDIDVKQAIALPQSPTNYICTVCYVTCYSEDFYQKHLSGRKHRNNISRINGGVECSDNSNKKPKQQIKPQVQKEKTKHKTSSSTTGREPKKQNKSQVQKEKTILKLRLLQLNMRVLPETPHTMQYVMSVLRKSGTCIGTRKQKDTKKMICVRLLHLLMNHHNKQSTRPKMPMIMPRNMALLWHVKVQIKGARISF